MNELTIALTFDVDPDAFDPSLHSDDPGALRWRGLREGVPAIVEAVEELAGRLGAPIPLTWMLRVDDTMAHVYGDAGYLLDEHRALWESLRSRGDELGWHPHLSRLVDGRWQQVTAEDELVAQLEAAREALAARGLTAPVSRIGEAFGAPVVFSTLERLGIRVDSTAMPGRVRQDEARTIDWGPTPQRPYHPSRDDHRVAGEPALGLLQVPMSMVPVRADYDERPFLRYVDLTFHARALQPGLSELLAETPLLVTVVHPSALVPGREHGLLAFDPGVFRANLTFVVETCARLGRSIRFVTLSSIADRAP